MQKTPENAEKANGDRQTDRPTDIAVHRVAQHPTKNMAVIDEIYWSLDIRYCGVLVHFFFLVAD